MTDKGGYVKGILRRVGVKKGNVISEQENELFRWTYDEAHVKFLSLAADWWDRASAYESVKEWDQEGNKIKVAWTVGDTRTEVEIWLERVE